MRLLFISLLLVGCSASTAQREICYANVRASFHLESDKCTTEACIDELSKIEAEELAQCRH